MGEINIQHVMMLGGSELSQFILSLFCVCVCVCVCMHIVFAEPRTVFVSMFCPLTVLPTRPLVVPFKALHSDMLAGNIA